MKINSKKSIDERVDLTASFKIISTPEDKDIELASKANYKPKSELKYGQVEVIVSNSAIDRHGESIEMDGIDVSQVKKNPVVLWAHDYSSLPIGNIVNIWKEAGNLMARLQLATEVYDFAGTVYKMILGGIINAVSIGGIVKQWNEDYTVIKQLEMVELSVVPVGAHPDALVTAKTIGMKPDILKEQYQDFLEKSLIDKLKVLPENEIESNIKALRNLTSALESARADFTASDNTKEPQKAKRIKLIIVRSTAKQIDKQSELLISSINKELDKISKK